MPGQVYYDLLKQGHPRLAHDLTRRLDLRSNLDRNDVEDFLDRWEDVGGPSTGYDWLAVARMWERAGEQDRARSALRRADGRIPESLLLLERARIAFMDEDVRGAGDYWRACDIADETTAVEAWLDIEVLATPAELEAWDRFRTLPAADRDDCAFLRRFWQLRAWASGMEVDDRVVDHYRRVRYALDHYRRRGRVRPRFSARLGRPTNSVFDDRGLLYIRMGPPDDLAMHGGDECIEPNASWAYNRPEGYRIYHLTPQRGVDDWYLLENLAAVYRCGVTSGVPSSAVSPMLIGIPPAALYDLYMSRMGLDPGYARIANQAMNRMDEFASLRLLEQLQQERQWTWEDGEYAIATVPERPAVDLSVHFGLEWLGFRAPRPGLTRVWLNALVRASTLRGDATGDGNTYRFDAVWTVRDERGSFYRLVPAAFELESPPDLDDEAGLSIRMPADLPPGEYDWMLAVRDQNTPHDAETPAGGYAIGQLTVRDMSADLPILSDVAVSPDSLGAWTPAPGISLNPSPTHATGPDGIAYIYYEAYNLAPGGQYETRVVIEPEDTGQAFDLSYPGNAPPGARIVTRGHLRVDLSTTAPGRYQVSVTVRDLTSGVTTLPVRTDIVVNRE